MPPVVPLQARVRVQTSRMPRTSAPSWSRPQGSETIGPAAFSTIDWTCLAWRAA
jgi:hypothetical protein